MALARDIRYVRNARPQATRVWIAETRLTLAPKGEHGDTIVVDAETLDDPDLAGYLDLGWVEELSGRPHLATTSKSSP